jgi:hypothetical protein
MSVIYISVSGQVMLSVYENKMYLLVMMVSVMRLEWISSSMRSSTAMRVLVQSEYTYVGEPTEVPCLLRIGSWEVDIAFLRFRN